MAAHQAPPSLGFSRQEHWSGLPFPSPMHESEKWKWSCSVVPTLSDPMDCNLPGSSVHGFSRQEYWSGVPLPSPNWFSYIRSKPCTWKWSQAWKRKVKVAQLFLTLCNPMDGSPPDSSVHGILQAGILEWVDIPFSRGSSWPRDWTWSFAL